MRTRQLKLPKDVLVNSIDDSIDKRAEVALKEQCREIFYAGIQADITRANRKRIAAHLDLVRGTHSLADVLFGIPPTPPADRLLIFPIRTYELIRQLKEQSDGKRADS